MYIKNFKSGKKYDNIISKIGKNITTLLGKNMEKQKNTHKCPSLRQLEEELGVGQDNILKVKRLHKDAIIPKTTLEGDIGYDLVAINNGRLEYDKNNCLLYIEYRTGLAFQLPKNYHLKVYPRSSLCNYDLILANHVANIDEGYRGEVLLRYKLMCYNWSFKEKVDISSIKSKYKIFNKGDKIAQMCIHKTFCFPLLEAKELDETIRGDRGFGSTGK